MVSLRSQYSTVSSANFAQEIHPLLLTETERLKQELAETRLLSSHKFSTESAEEAEEGLLLEYTKRTLT
jgi:hypothetical protein